MSLLCSPAFIRRKPKAYKQQYRSGHKKCVTCRLRMLRAVGFRNKRNIRKLSRSVRNAVCKKRPRNIICKVKLNFICSEGQLIDRGGNKNKFFCSRNSCRCGKRIIYRFPSSRNRVFGLKRKVLCFIEISVGYYQSYFHRCYFLIVDLIAYIAVLAVGFADYA